MAAGAMDQQVRIQARVETADGIGGLALAWQDVAVNANVWAKVTMRRAGEAMQDGRMNATQTVTFEIHNRSDVSEVNRLLWNGEAWNIRGVQRSGNRRLTILIDAERGAAS